MCNWHRTKMSCSLLWIAGGWWRSWGWEVTGMLLLMLLGRQPELESNWPFQICMTSQRVLQHLDQKLLFGHNVDGDNKCRKLGIFKGGTRTSNDLTGNRSIILLLLLWPWTVARESKEVLEFGLQINSKYLQRHPPVVDHHRHWWLRESLMENSIKIQSVDDSFHYYSGANCRVHSLHLLKSSRII